MSQQNKTTLQSAINTQLADNTSGDISAADVRDNLINMTDSLLFNSGSQGITGSLTATSFTGSLQGTATTASYVLNAISASYAATASIANVSTQLTITGAGGVGTLYPTLVGISAGNLNVSTKASNLSFNQVTSQLFATSITSSFTGSLQGTATSAVSASYAATASVLLGSVTSASYALTASYIVPTTPQSILIAVDGIGSNFVSSSNNPYKEYLIPANTLTTSSILEVEAGITKDTFNGLTNVYFSISSSISETSIAYVSISTGNTYSPLWRNFAISGSSIIYLNTATSLATDASATNASILTTSIDTTIDNYLKVFAFTPASNSVSRLSYCKITAHK